MAEQQLYFRIRENGATAFRIVEDGARHRTHLEALANVNLRNGEVKAHGKVEIAPDEMAQIAEWVARRQADAPTRKEREAEHLCDQLGLVAQWLKAEADDAAVARLSHRLLWGMHDLRSTLIRRQAGTTDEAEQ